MNEKNIKVIKPQEGPQEQFSSCTADIAIFGGSAGGGKTFISLMEPLHYIGVDGFNATFFRRTRPEITAPGGLWDEAQKMYLPLGAQMVGAPQLCARFKNSRIDFRTLQYEKDVYSWQGAQLCLILYDELTHFSKNMFFYLLSRNRSTCGVNPYIRATCNPDPDSWVREFISWWIDEETGYPIPERSGKVRYFIQLDDKIIWAGRKRDLKKYINLSKNDIDSGIKVDDLIKSATFISSSIYDNKELLKVNPQYLASLKAMPEVEREQLLYGNWNIKRVKGDYFKAHWFNVIDELPPHWEIASAVRGWDRAATEKTTDNEPDFTAGVLVLKTKDDRYIIADSRTFRERPATRNKYMINACQADKLKFKSARSILEKDPGQAGVAEADELIRLFTNNNLLVSTVRPTTKKFKRALPFSAACENGLVSILHGSWNDAYLKELEQFSNNPKDYLHDDQVDATTAAFNFINGGESAYSLDNLTSL